ncbi:MAG: hypothetical protein JW809_07180 [Pirellulales bacterium]|nr:hypothetical protein [Pirellulales bacterium]
MMGRLLGLVGAIGTLLVVFLVGTAIAAGVMVFIVWSKWNMDARKLEQMIAIAQGYDLAAMRDEAERLRQIVPPEQPSFDALRDLRAVKSRDLELREQALAQALEEFRFKQRKQTEDLRHFNQVRQDFEAQLSKINETSGSGGMEENIVILQNMKPNQAKDQLVKMYDDGDIDAVVRLVAGMNPSKRKRITAEFKEPEDEDKLAEILRRIREGYPLAALAGQTEESLQRPAPAQP